MTPNTRVFRNLTAGSTAIMPSGKVIRFSGKIQKVEGGTVVGHGSYFTSDPEEIDFLIGLSKQPSPQVWEELAAAPEAVPATVTVVTEQAAVQTQLVASAVAATSPSIEVLLARAKAEGLPAA